VEIEGVMNLLARNPTCIFLLMDPGIKKPIKLFGALNKPRLFSSLVALEATSSEILVFANS
jgi:hypothetical protein